MNYIIIGLIKVIAALSIAYILGILNLFVMISFDKDVSKEEIKDIEFWKEQFEILYKTEGIFLSTILIACIGVISAFVVDFILWLLFLIGGGNF